MPAQLLTTWEKLRKKVLKFDRLFPSSQVLCIGLIDGKIICEGGLSIKKNVIKSPDILIKYQDIVTAFPVIDGILPSAPAKIGQVNTEPNRRKKVRTVGLQVDSRIKHRRKGQNLFGEKTVYDESAKIKDRYQRRAMSKISVSDVRVMEEDDEEWTDDSDDDEDDNTSYLKLLPKIPTFDQTKSLNDVTDSRTLMNLVYKDGALYVNNIKDKNVSFVGPSNSEKVGMSERENSLKQVQSAQINDAKPGEKNEVPSVMDSSKQLAQIKSGEITEETPTSEDQESGSSQLLFFKPDGQLIKASVERNVSNIDFENDESIVVVNEEEIPFEEVLKLVLFSQEMEKNGPVTPVKNNTTVATNSDKKGEVVAGDNKLSVVTNAERKGEFVPVDDIASVVTIAEKKGEAIAVDNNLITVTNAEKNCNNVTGPSNSLVVTNAKKIQDSVSAVNNSSLVNNSKKMQETVSVVNNLSGVTNARKIGDNVPVVNNSSVVSNAKKIQDNVPFTNNLLVGTNNQKTGNSVRITNNSSTVTDAKSIGNTNTKKIADNVSVMNNSSPEKICDSTSVSTVSLNNSENISMVTRSKGKNQKGEANDEKVMAGSQKTSNNLGVKDKIISKTGKTNDTITNITDGKQIVSQEKDSLDLDYKNIKDQGKKVVVSGSTLSAKPVTTTKSIETDQMRIPVIVPAIPSEVEAKPKQDDIVEDFDDNENGPMDDLPCDSESEDIPQNETGVEAEIENINFAKQKKTQIQDSNTGKENTKLIKILPGKRKISGKDNSEGGELFPAKEVNIEIIKKEIIDEGNLPRTNDKIFTAELEKSNSDQPNMKKTKIVYDEARQPVVQSNKKKIKPKDLSKTWECCDCGQVFQTRRLKDAHRKQMHSGPKTAEEKLRRKRRRHARTEQDIEGYDQPKFEPWMKKNYSKLYKEKQKLKRMGVNSTQQPQGSNAGQTDGVNGKNVQSASNAASETKPKEIFIVQGNNVMRICIENNQPISSENSVATQGLDSNHIKQESGRVQGEKGADKKYSKFSRDWQCPDCGKYFSSRRNRTIHRKLKHPKVKVEKTYTCESCGETFSKKKLFNKHVLGHRVHQCDICSKICKSNTSLYQHKKTHNPERPFHCDLCDASFKQNCTLVSHRYSHYDDKNFVCEVCGKAFKRKISLDQHMKTHDDDKPFVCHICNKNFKLENQLNEHVNAHSGIYPHICEYCGKGHLRKDNLLKHIRIHHREKTSEPPKAFKRKSKDPVSDLNETMSYIKMARQKNPNAKATDMFSSLYW